MAIWIQSGHTCLKNKNHIIYYHLFFALIGWLHGANEYQCKMTEDLPISLSKRN